MTTNSFASCQFIRSSRKIISTPYSALQKENLLHRSRRPFQEIQCITHFVLIYIYSIKLSIIYLYTLLDRSGFTVSSHHLDENHTCIVWSRASCHDPVVGWFSLQSSNVQKVWHDVTKRRDPFNHVQVSHSTSTEAPQAITFPPSCLTDGVKHSSKSFHLFCISQMFSSPSNLKLEASVPNIFFLCPVSMLCPS